MLRDNTKSLEMNFGADPMPYLSELKTPPTSLVGRLCKPEKIRVIRVICENPRFRQLIFENETEAVAALAE